MAHIVHSVKKKELFNSWAGVVFTCCFTADIEGSTVHGQEKTDLLSTVNARLIFSIFFIFFLSAPVGVHVHRKDS